MDLHNKFVYIYLRAFLLIQANDSFSVIAEYYDDNHVKPELLKCQSCVPEITTYSLSLLLLAKMQIIEKSQ